MSKFLVAVDLSPLAPEIIAQACRLAKTCGAQVTVMHVVPNLSTWRGYEPALPFTMEEDMEQAARTKLQSFIDLVVSRDEAYKEVIDGVVVESGNAPAALTSYAEEGGYSMILLGNRGAGALERLLVGSTASAVARLASMSVLILRPDVDLF